MLDKANIFGIDRWDICNISVMLGNLWASETSKQGTIFQTLRVDKFCQSAGVPDNFIHRGIPGGGRSHRRQNMSLIPRSGRGRGGVVVPLWSVYTTTPSPHLMSYCVSRSSGSRRRGIRLWFSTRWASHFSLHYVTKIMSKKGSLWLIFDRYFSFWKQAIFIPLSFSPKQNFIYIQKGFLLPPAGVNICPPYATDCVWFG